MEVYEQMSINDFLQEKDKTKSDCRICTSYKDGRCECLEEMFTEIQEGRVSAEECSGLWTYEQEANFKSMRKSYGEIFDMSKLIK